MPALKPLLIAGPTASGKSRLALDIARRDGGWIVNADALQVYSCWRVLTARPDAAEEARAPHRLYGHVPPEAAYSVGAWLREIAAVLAEARAAGARPIIVGGTGLNFTALTLGLAEIPPIPPQVRARSEALLAAGTDALLEDLAAADPETLGRLDRANPRRVQRAWEVLEATGIGLAAWQARGAAPLLPEPEVQTVVIMPQVDRLNRRIAERFAAMLDQGALTEAAAFRDLGLPPGLPSAQALGASALLDHLAGRIDLAAATAAAVTATRQYAKRQRSWMRSRMAHWTWIDPERPGAAR